MTGWVARSSLDTDQLIPAAGLPRGRYGDRFQEVTVDDDGKLHVAWGGAGLNSGDGTLVVYSLRAAEYVLRSLWLGGQLLKLGGYLGQTVSMMRLGPMLSAIDNFVYEDGWRFPFKHPSTVTWYEQSVGCPARTLAERPHDVARDLVAPLFRELTQGKLDPYP
jgi:hypothetical protein